MTSPPQRPTVVKRDGSVEPFRERKFRASLRRSGASRAEIEDVLEAVRSELQDGTHTRDLYRIAHRILRSRQRPRAARYGLQRALQELGPSGFAFEVFVARLWQSDGFEPEVGVHLRGRFVSHEIDVIARRDDLRTLTECKLRTRTTGKIDVRIAMYVFGRAVDLDAIGYEGIEFWLVTNGRFTSDAIAYGEGMGLHLLGWNHPKGNALRERIDRAGLHPITALTTLRSSVRRALLADDVVLCRDLLARPELLEQAGLGERKIRTVLEEAAALCPDR